MVTTVLQGAGLGLRRSMLDDVAGLPAGVLDFLEITPENWMNLGGSYARRLRQITERYPMTAHGLSLSLGGPSPIDREFVADLKNFFDKHQVVCFSEHLSYCSDSGHLYDLLPIPFTEEAVYYVADRIREVQDILERRIAIENVSYYAMPSKELDEITFVNAVLNEADCDLLLDVNNVYVNSVNHDYDPRDYISALPLHRVAYMHIAGHYKEHEKLIVDTHGAPVIHNVWELLEYTYTKTGHQPTLLERDFNLPPLDELLDEVAQIRRYQPARETENEQRQTA